MHVLLLMRHPVVAIRFRRMTLATLQAFRVCDPDQSRGSDFRQVQTVCHTRFAPTTFQLVSDGVRTVEIKLKFY